ncbi:AgrD family cyclic lactone autoinducer peptide [Paenibacillus lactis]
MKKGMILFGAFCTALATAVATPASWFLIYNPTAPKSLKK